MRTFGLTKTQASGIIGNLAHESGAFTQLVEIGHPDRGLGWAQWTGPRRRTFMAYCQSCGQLPGSYVANYGYLVKELSGPYKCCIDAIKKTKTLEEATISFEQCYERAGVVAMVSRIKWAKRSYLA